MFDFSEAIKQGQEKANNIIENRKKISKSFKEMNEALKGSGHPICLSLKENTSISLEDMANLMKGDVVNYAKSKRGSLVLEVFDNTGTVKERLDIGSWIQHNDGFPITLDIFANRIDCWDLEALYKAQSEILSNGDFWLKATLLENRMLSKK